MNKQRIRSNPLPDTGAFRGDQLLRGSFRRLKWILAACFIFAGKGILFAQCPPVITCNPANATICADTAAFLTVTSPTAPAYQWYKNNVLIPDSTRSTLRVRDAGSYKVTYPACGLFSNVINVTVNPSPTGTISITPTPPVCSGQAVTIQVTTNPVNTIFWVNPTAPTNTNPVVTSFSSSDLIIVILRNPNTSCTKSLDYFIDVNQPINGGTITADQTICTNTAPAQLNGGPASGGNGTYNYQWQSSTTSGGPWSDIPGATGINYQPGVLTVTTYFRRLAYSPPCQNGSSNTVTITVNPAPTVLGGSTLNICSGGYATYSPSSAVIGTTFAWTGSVTSPTVPVTGVTASGTGNINDQLSLNPNGNSTGEATYVITPTGPAPTFCVGTNKNFVVSVYPIPVITNPVLSEIICSGTAMTPVTWTSTVTGTTYTWYTTSPPGVLVPQTSGTGNLPGQTLTNNTFLAQTVTFHVTPTGPAPNNCPGLEVLYTVQLQPAPTVTNTPLTQEVCSNQPTTLVTLTSNIPGTTFTWTATANPPSLTGWTASGTATIPVQTIINPTYSPGTVTYHIIPSGPGGSCNAVPRDYVITVNPIPNISSSLTGTTCSNAPFSYTITSDVAGCTFTWSRASVPGIVNPPNNGATSSITETLVNTTTSPVDVTYVLTPTGPANTSCPGPPQNLVVSVKPQPTVDAGPDQTINNGTSTTLAGSASPGTGIITSIAWTPAGMISGPSNILNPLTVVLTTNQVYYLNVTDGGGCSNTDYMTVVVTGTGLAVNPTASPEPICETQVAHLHANATGGSGNYTYSWSSIPAGFTSTSANPDDTPLVTTAYTVTVNDGFSSVSGSHTVIVNPLPQAFTVGGGGEYCATGAGLSITLSGSQLNVHYQLYLGGVPLGLELPGTGSPLDFGAQASAGTYTVRAHVVATGCEQNMTGSASVIVNPLPVVSAGTDQTIAYGISTTLNGSASGGTGALGYLWSPAISIAAGQTTLINPQTTNIYATTQFTFTVTDAKGCVSADNMWVTLSGNPLSATIGASPQVICNNGATVNLSSAGAGGSGSYTYSWTSLPAGFTSTLQNPPVNPTVTTTYFVQVNDGYNVKDTSVLVTVNPLPLQFNVTGGGSYCLGGPGLPVGLSGSETGVTYTLLRDGFPIAPAVAGTGGPISFGNQTGAFNYTVTATNDVTNCMNTMNGSVNITIWPLPSLFTVTGGGSYAFGGPGVHIGISGSEIGVNYRLIHLPDTLTPAPGVPGTGLPLDFGFQTLAGTYIVSGRDGVSNCPAEMLGSANVTINMTPTPFNLIGGGAICQGQSGITLHLDGSEIGIRYVMRRNGDSISFQNGTGNPLDFGPYTTAGAYSVKGVNIANLASSMMNGTAQIVVNPLPQIYMIEPQGDTCQSTVISLNGSQLGVKYYLILNASVMIDSLFGTGLPGYLSFGPQNTPGTYRCQAYDTATHCYAWMIGQSVLHENPVVYNLIPNGILCIGDTMWLAGSQTGIRYQLIRNSTQVVSTIWGTGDTLNLGALAQPGTYEVTAMDTVTHCYSYMNGGGTVYPAPQSFAILPQPAGHYCKPVSMGLNGSQTGVVYKLVRGLSDTVASTPGTNSAISFSPPQTTQGYYRVYARISSSHCGRWMEDSIWIDPSPVVYNLVPSGPLCLSDSMVHLDGSDTGIRYELINTTTGITDTTLMGTGSALFFGSPNTAGTYMVKAIDTVFAAHCFEWMNGQTVFNPSPASFTVNPAGDQCPGTQITLSGSQITARYILYRQTGAVLDSVTSRNGTGGALNFGSQNQPGLYKVKAEYINSPHCTSWMSGSTNIIENPHVYSTIISYPPCIPATIGLNGSQLNMDYQLVLLNPLTYLDIVAGTGAPISFGAQNTAGDYTVIARHSSGTRCTTWMNDTVVLRPTPGVFSMFPSGDTCTGANIRLLGSELNVTYSLFLGNIPVASLTGTGSVLNFGFFYSPGIYHIVTDSAFCSVQMNGSLALHAKPNVYNVVPIGLSCDSTEVKLLTSDPGITYELMKSGLGISTLTGTGNLLNFGYQHAGTYTIRAFYGAFPLCDTLMNGTVVINPLPSINAGSDISVCAGHPVTLSASGTNFNPSTVLWSGGTGTYTPNPPNSLTVSYLPLLTSGSETLTVTVYGTAPECSARFTSDQVSININPLPAISTGPDTTVCANTSSIHLYASAPGYTTFLWTSSGTGQFIPSPAVINPDYVISPADKIAGNISLKLTSSGQSLCPADTISDNRVLFIDAVPQVNAGSDTLICASDSARLHAQSVAGQNPLWQKILASDGQILSPNSLITVYVPGPFDISRGFAYLRISVEGTLQCSSLSHSDTIRINIHPPLMSFLLSPDGDTCSGVNICLSGSQAQTIYRLYINNVFLVGSVSGTGVPGLICFGPQTQPGVYRCQAENLVTGCKAWMNGTVTLVGNPTVFNLLPNGYICAGDTISLSGSETGFTYKLIYNNTIELQTIAGTGFALNFGPQQLPGTYIIRAFRNNSPFCYSEMNGTATLQTAPAPYALMPAGHNCPAPVDLYLNNSETGVTYHLYHGLGAASSLIVSKPGTGGVVNFGMQSLTGPYTVKAVNNLSNCSRWMADTVWIDPSPVVYDIIPNGSSCTPTNIRLSNSQTGYSYQLWRDGIVLDTLPGTNGMLDFGTQTFSGNYTIIGIGANPLCYSLMNGTAVLHEPPVVFSIVPSGDTCARVPIGVNGSQLNVNYVLRHDGMPVETKAGTGSSFFFNHITTAGTYTVRAYMTTSDSCSSMMNGSLLIHPLPIAYNLMPNGANCEPTSVFLSGAQAGVEYRLLKDGIPTGPWQTTSGFGPQMAGTYRAIGRWIATFCQDTMPGTVIITPGAISNAGIDTTVCYGHSITLNGSAQNFSTVHWTTRGNGTFIPALANILNPVYTPGPADLTAGSVWLIMEASGTAPCPFQRSLDSLLLSIHPQPTANAGPNDTICEGFTFTTASASATNYTLPFWRTAGDGTFSFGTDTLTNAVYTPGPLDIANQSVILRLTVHGNQECSGDTVFDTMILRIQHLPVANAGPDDSICENHTYQLSGGRLYSSTSHWETLGDGSFDNPLLLGPVYTPGPGDILAGTVSLRLIADGQGKCISVHDTDLIQLIIRHLPAISSGPDTTVCAAGSYAMNVSTAVRFSTLQWRTSGDGLFSNAAILHPVYTPGPADTAAHTVSLSLTAHGYGQCMPDSVTDSMVLNFHPSPVSMAGADTNGCPNEPLSITGQAINWSAVLWQSLGDGTFTSPSTLATTYNAGYNDKTAGFADLVLTVTGSAECSGFTDKDTVRVTYRPLPTAIISGNFTICENDSIPLLITLTGTAPWTVTYTDGLGTFTRSNIMATPYQLYVKPVTTTTYMLLSVHDNYCSGNILQGSAIVYVNPRPNLYQFTASNNGIYCAGTNGVLLTLDNSQPGVSYQLYFNSASSGAPLPGTGSPLNFGWVTNAGVYKVLCTNLSTLCYRYTDSVYVIIMPLPLVNFTADSTCVGDSTHFTVNGPDIGKISLWTWYFGDGTTSTYTSPFNPAHLYPAPGTYHVQMEALDTNGCTQTIHHYITVGLKPFSNFAYSQINCSNTGVSFTDLSNPGNIGYLTQWHWYFGDGTDTIINWPSSPNLIHIYPAAGTYQVLLRIETSRGCSDTTAHQVIVSPAAAANFTYTAPCQTMPMQFTDQTTIGGGYTIASWNWTFGDPTTGMNNFSTLQNPQHTYSAYGPYQVKLKVTTLNGCLDSITKTVTVEQAPMAVFLADTTCSGDSTHFTDQSIPNSATMVSWLWDFGDGTATSAVQNPVHRYGTTGTYQVHLTVTNSNQCSKDTVIPVHVWPLPVAAYISDAPKCMGSLVTFISQSTTSHGTLNSWVWDWGDGTTTTIGPPGAASVSHIFVGTALQHTVRLTVTNTDGCSGFVEHVITSLARPTADFSIPATTCQAQAITFHDLSAGNGPPLTSWYWDFGDPGSGVLNHSTLQDPTHTYVNSGPYTVKLVVTNQNTCSDTAQKPFTVNLQPVADFSYDTSCFGSPTQFNDLSTPNAGSITYYDWDFGDGSTHLHVPNPSHTYVLPGTYNAVLTITNSNGCIHSVTKSVSVMPAPVALFTTTTNNCVGTKVDVHDQSTTPHGYIVRWTWDFGDGTIISIPFPTSQDTSHIYAVAGSYNIILTIKSSDSCVASHTIPVTVHSRPIANFTYPPSNCEQSAVHFVDASQANNGGTISAWNWNFGEPISGVLNFSTLQNPDHIYHSFGAFTVNLVATNVNGCKDTAIHVLYLHDAPFVDYAADTACLGDSTHFTDLSSPIDSLIAWQWDFGDGSASNLQSPAHKYTAAGVYTVKLSVTNQSNCGHDTTKQVLVRPVPQALFSVANNCAGVPTTFTDQSYTPEGVLVSWNWDFGDGQTSTLPSPVHLYATYGTYTVTLTVTNSYGCSGTYSKNVVIYRNPTADFSFQNSYCPAGIVSFSDHTTPYNTTLSSWEWIFEPGQGSNVPNPVHTFPVTDTTYNVTLITTDANGCIDTVLKPVFVKPAFEFTFNALLGCTGSATEFVPVNLAVGDSITGVSWTFGDPSSGSANYSNDYIGVHQYLNPGNYVVKMKAWNSDLCADSILKTVNIKKGPVANFLYDNLPHCDSTVTFQNKYVSNGLVIDTIQWIFPDTTITDTPPFPATITHKFSGFGVFPVTQLVHASNGCTGSVTKDVTVSCVSAGFTVSSPPRCSGQIVSFNDKSGPTSLITNWNWDFGDGNDTVYNKFASIIRHRYLASGDYTVTLVISSVSGVYTVRDTLRQQIQVMLSPGSSFTVQQVCLGDTSKFINLTDTVLSQITSYKWSFGDPSSGNNNTSTKAFPWHLYSKAGKYNVSLISRNADGCQDTMIRKAVVHKLPQAAFTTTKLCARDIVQFSDETKLGDTSVAFWYWDLGDTHNANDTSFLPDPTHIYDWPGNYGVLMKVVDRFGCSDTTLKLINIRPTPISAFSFVQDYQGKAGQLKFTNLSKDATRYYWIFGNGDNSNLENPPPVLYEDDNLTYTISLIASNSQNCSDTTSYDYEFTFHGLYVPNAFSPTNESEAVRKFIPQGINLASYHLTVYDSWGHLLFESSKLDPVTGAPTEGWDGTYNGELMPQGTFMWKIVAVFKDGTNWEGSDNGTGMGGTMGIVTLIR